jgi:PAS domain S-box-containing protein
VTFTGPLSRLKIKFRAAFGLGGPSEADQLNLRLMAVLDAIEDGVIVTDRRGKYLLTNPAAERILGGKLGELERIFRDNEHPPLRPDGSGPLPARDNPLLRALRGQVARGVELIARNPFRPEGVHLTSTGAPLRFADGKVQGAVIVFRDIGERKRAEARARLEVELVRVLADSSGADPIAGLLEALCRDSIWSYAAFWEVEENSKRLRTTECWHDQSAVIAAFEKESRALALARGEGLPGRVWESRSPAWVTEITEDPNFPRTAPAREAGLRSACAFPVFSRGRLLGVVEIFSRVHVERDGDLLRLLASLGAQIGLTVDRRRAEAAAAEAAASVKAVIDASTEVAIISTDSSGVIQLFNVGAERMLGYDARELVGIKTPALLHEPAEIAAHAETLLREFGRPVAGFAVFVHKASLGGSETKEWTYVRKDGGKIPVSLSVTAIRDAAGEIRGFLGIATDLTERRRREAELERAKDVAVRAARVKTEFLANMSHEIRTPLNAVIGMSELLLDTALDPRQKEYAGTVRSAGDALLTLINDILDFSKIEAGKMQLESIGFDLRASMESAVDLLAAKARAKGVELAVSLPPGTPTGLRGDPSRLRQILLNLIGNAIKFTDRGGVVVSAARCGEENGKVVLRMSVADSGMGIPEQVRARLFRSFVQADASTTRKFGGTGLGLAISRDLTELMGGRIGVESEVGKGSTFWIEIPFELVPDAVQAPPRRADLEGLRALIVDDSEANLEILSKQLAGWGLLVHECRDGESGLAAMKAAARDGAPFALAVVDMRMPGMDGLAFSKAARDQAALATTRILLLTSSGEPPSAIALETAGVSGCLIKPVRQAALYEGVVSALTGNAPPAPGSVAQTSAPSPQARPKRRLRVLIVDDNEINLRLLALQLEKLGYACDQAVDGAQALTQLQAAPYELVFMDCQMPGMDGYEATRAVRKLALGWPQPTIVAMTANATPQDREKCLAAGMNDHLAKPLRTEDLARLMAAQDAPLRAEVVREIRSMAGERFSEMAATFADNCTRYAAEMRDALARGERAVIERVSHTMIGSTGSFGAAGLQRLCRLIEKSSAAGQFEGVKELLAELDVENARVAAALKGPL